MNDRRVSGPLGSGSSWSGNIELAGDVIVPAGRRLVVSAGASVGCEREPSRSPRFPRLAFTGLRGDAQRPTARLIVEGELVVHGTPAAPARFGGEFWGGILAVGRSRITLRHAVLSAPDRALVAIDFTRAVLSDCALSGEISGASFGGCARGLFRRCRFERSAQTGLLAADDARVLASSCAFEGTATGAAAEGAARLRLRGCAARGCATTGLRASAASRVLARGVRFEHCGVAAAAQGRSGLELEACRASGERVAWEAVDDARLSVRRCESRGQETGLWVQNRARARCEDARFEGGRFGLRASHGSRLTARRVETEGQSNAHVLVEDEAFAAIVRCPGVSAVGWPVLRGRARADFDGVQLPRPKRRGR